eukprot:s141_g24.t1
MYILLIRRPAPVSWDDFAEAEMDVDPQASSSTNLLQVRAARHHSSYHEQEGRLTTGQVAHTQWPLPGSRTPLNLESLIDSPPRVLVDFSPVHRLLDTIHQLDFHFLQAIPAHLELHPATSEALATLCSIRSSPPVAFHFYTDGSKISHGAVGAGVVLLIEYAHGQAIGGTLSKTICLDGHAGMGENGAVIWALLWAVQLSTWHWHQFGLVPLHFYFHFDAINAGFLAGGYFRTTQFPQHRVLMRSLAQLLQVRHGQPFLHWHHVKAHSGNPWNELADTLARQASLQATHVDLDCPWQAWLTNSTTMTALQWLWYLELMLSGSHWAAPYHDGFLDCPLLPIPQPHCAPDPQTASSEYASASVPSQNHVQLCITIATANVLTLQQSLPSGQPTITRQAILMRQFHERQCIIVGLQETRHKHLVGLNNSYYHIFGHAATPQGTDGTQLWVSNSLPIGPEGMCIRKDHLRLVAAHPDYVIVKISMPLWRCVVITGRAPHSGRPYSEAKHFWTTISEVLQRKAAGWPVIFCGDANAHVGASNTIAIGPLAPQQENQAGQLFHEWLLKHNLFLPATFAEFHPGADHTTFVSADETRTTRIDYVALPMLHKTDKIHSEVAVDIDISLSRRDHHAVLCRLSFWTSPLTAPATKGPTKWDSHHLQHTLAQEATHHQLHDLLVPPPWHLDPHQSAHWLACTTTTALTHVAQPRQLWKRKSHVTQDTWDLVTAKKSCFRQLRALQRTGRYTVLHACFQLWRSTGTTVQTALIQDLPGWLRLHHHALAQTMHKLRLLSLQVGNAIRQDDAAYYQQLAAQSSQTYTVEGLTGIWKHLRALLPKNRHKFNQPTYDLGPSLQLHFQDLEAGVSTTKATLFSQCVSRNNDELRTKPMISFLELSELPTLVEIEDHCLRQRPHKATGPDAIPSTLCRSGAAVLAPAVHALVCKTMLCGVEAFEHKGGHLCKAAQLTTSVLFLDLRSAFHHMLRELIFTTTAGLTQQELLTIFDSNHFDIEALSHKLDMLCASDVRDMPPGLRQLLHDVHQHTWFQLRDPAAQDHQCTHTRRGTRPGSPIADIGFNLLMADLLQDLHQDLLSLDSYVEGSDPMGIYVPPIAWMDDVAIPLTTTTPAAMVPLLQQAARIFIHWIEHDFSDLQAMQDIDIHQLAETAHLSLLEDLHIWHLRSRLRSLQAQLDRLDCAPAPLPRPVRAAPVPHQRLHRVPSAYAQMRDHEMARRTWRLCSSALRPLSPVQGPFYVVHLYSGRRREDDFHQFMQQLINSSTHAIASAIHVISIDTAISETMNVHSEKIWTFLLTAAQAGHILGYLLGPPCETWSSARFEQTFNEDGLPLPGPRPLRDVEACWGISGLSLRELQQVSVGNCLLLKGLHLAVPIAFRGGVVVLEHPAPPIAIERPSIFRTGIVRFLLQPGTPFRRYTFAQWRHGAPGIKPTTLLFANAMIPKVMASFERLDLAKPTTALIGKDSSGAYRTSRAKEYPAGMNRALATAMWQAIEATGHRHRIDPVDLPSTAAELAELSASVDRCKDFLPDYQPVQ